MAVQIGKTDTLEIIYKDNSKKVIPIERVEDIYIMTEFDFNTALLNFLAQYGVKIHFFNYYGFYTGTYYPKESLVSGKLLIKQVENYTDINKRIKIAKAFIESASYNIHRNLIYYKNNLEVHIFQYIYLLLDQMLEYYQISFLFSIFAPLRYFQN